MRVTCTKFRALLGWTAKKSAVFNNAESRSYRGRTSSEKDGEGKEGRKGRDEGEKK